MKEDDLATEHLLVWLCSKSKPQIRDLRSYLLVDGLCLPNLTTRLRRWANQKQGLSRLVVGHNGKTYTIAALIEMPSVELLAQTQLELEALDAFNGRPMKCYVVGPDHADAPMFYRPSLYEIWSSPHCNLRSAAA